MSVQPKKLKDSFDPGKRRNAGVFKAFFFLTAVTCSLLFFAMNEQKAIAEDCECKVCHGPSGPHGGGFPGCDACHGDPPTDSSGLVWYPAPTGATKAGAHAKHATSQGYNYACGTCHYNGMPETLVAEDPPLLQIGFSISTGNATYDGHALNAPYSYEGTNGTVVTTGGTKTCSNIYCHSNGTSLATGVTQGSSSPPWDAAGPFACNICHGFPPSYAQDQPKSNSHVFHDNFTCNTCHYATTTDGTTITNFTNHANQLYTVVADPNVSFGGPLSFNYSFDPGGGKCSNVTCHGYGPNQKTWGGVDLTAGVGWVAGPECFQIQFVGHLNGTPPQSFSWNFGDGQIGTGENVSHLYASSGEYEVQLSAIDANRHRAETLAHVIVQPSNQLPVPDRTVTVSGYTVTLTDYSTDPDYNTCGHSGPGTMRVQWGATGAPDTEISVDLTDTRPSVGRSVSYTYTTSGNYTIRHAVRDNSPSGYVYSSNTAVTVPTKYTVQGKVTRSDGTTAISGVTLYLKSATKTYAAVSRTDGSYTFSNVEPGTYYITATKVGYTFSNPAVTGIAVTSGSVTGINFSSITP